VSSITPGDRGSVSSRVKVVSLELLGLLPLAHVPTVSGRKNFFFHITSKNFQQVLIFDSSVPSLDLSVKRCAPSGQMTLTRVLILGHSFIRRLREYVERSNNMDANLHIREGIELKWHRVWGRTIRKTVQIDRLVVKSFKPDIVILQLGTSPMNVCSAIEDLTRPLHDSLNVKCVCVCQTIYRTGAATFKKHVILLNWCLKVLQEPISYAIFWSHTGFWRAETNFN